MTCQPWPSGQSTPIAGRLILTSTLLVFYPAPVERGGGQMAGKLVAQLPPEPCALPLNEILKMSVASLGDEAGDSRLSCTWVTEKHKMLARRYVG